MEEKFIDHFYVVKDLSCRGPLELQTFSTLEGAMEAYRKLPNQSLKALGAENTMPLPGSIDLVQCLHGTDRIVQDYQAVSAWDRPEIYAIIDRLENEMGASERQQILFTDAMGNRLFAVEDGGNIVLTKPDGSKAAFPCRYLHEGAVQVGNTLTTVRAFAKRCQNMGFIYAPEKPHEGDCIDTYEIYHLRNSRDCEYAWRAYRVAENQIKAEDYDKVFSGVLAPQTSMGDLFDLHNQDDRPMGEKIHSLSMSDVIVTSKNGVRTAHYVDSFGFKEIPNFAEKLAAVPNMPQPQFRAHRSHREER